MSNKAMETDEDAQELGNARVSDDNSGDAEIGERLKQAIQNAGGASLVSRETGIALSTLDNYMAGRGIKLVRAAALAAHCGFSLDWLANGAEKPILAKLFSAVDTDRFARAIAIGDEAISQKGAVPDDRQKAVMYTLIYDMLTAQDLAKSRRSK